MNLSFSMSRLRHRRVWEILVAIPAGQRTDRVCQMVLESHDREEFLEAIRRMIQEEFRRRDAAAPPIDSTREAGDVGDDVLDFLLSLQNEGGDHADSIF